MVAHAPNPLMVVRTFTVACNAHDLDAALAHFADDAVARHTPAPDGVGVYHGKGEIRRWLQPQLAGFHVDTSEERVSGDLVRWSARVTQHLLRQIGLPDPLAADLAAVVRDGKIVAFEVTNPTLMSTPPATSPNRENGRCGQRQGERHEPDRAGAAGARGLRLSRRGREQARRRATPGGAI